MCLFHFGQLLRYADKRIANYNERVGPTSKGTISKLNMIP